MFPELQIKNLDQILCSKSEQKFSFMTKPQLPNLQQTVANSILLIDISNQSYCMIFSYNRIYYTRTTNMGTRPLAERDKLLAKTSVS